MDLFKLVGRIVIDNSEANQDLDDTTSKASSSGEGIMSGFKKVGAAVATYFTVDAIKNFGAGCITAAADASAASSQFSQVFGDFEGSASKSLKNIANESGISENRMKGSFTQIAAFAKTSGMDTESALGLSERAMVAVADSAAFYDRSLEDTTESLQSFLKGNYENDSALGLSCTETTRNAAANELYGKSFKDLSESQKQLTLLQMVEDANAASGAMGQAARESDTWSNQTGNLKQAWTDFQAVLGAKALPVAVGVVKSMAEGVQKLTDKVPSIIQKFNAFKQKATELGNYIGNKLKPIFTDIKNVFNTVKDAVQPIIDAFMEYFTSGEAVNDITETIKTGVDLLATAYEGAKEFIQDVIDKFKDAVKWGKEHETGLTLIGIALGTVTAAIVAYNVAQAIKNAGGIAEIAQLGILQVQLWALSAAQAAQTVATTIATAATSAFGAVMSFVTSPITLVVLAIGALIAIGVLLYKNWDVVKEKALELWDNLKTNFENIKTIVSEKVETLKASVIEKWEALKTLVSDTVENLKMSLVEKWEALKTLVSTTVENIKTALIEKWEAIKTGITTVVDTIKNGISIAWESIKTVISTVVEVVKTVIITYFNFYRTIITTILNAVMTVVTTVWNGIKTAITVVVNAIKTAITTAWNWIKTITSTVFNSLKAVATTAWNGLKTAVTTVVNAVRSTVTNVWNGIRNTTSSVFNSVKTIVSNIWNGIKTTISNVINGVKGTITSGLTSAKSTISSILNSIKTKFSNIFESAKSIVTGAIEAIKGVFNFSWSLPPLKLPHISVSGGEAPFGIGGKGSLPKFSISWYKKAMDNAMLLNNPTIFGYSAASGNYLGGGEAGTEVVAGSQTLMKMIEAAVARQDSGIAMVLYKILDAILALDENMGGHMREALAGTSFEVNKREFARLVKAVN